MAWYDEQAEILAGGAKHLETAIAEALRQARNEALEEARDVLGHLPSACHYTGDRAAYAAGILADADVAIRALKETAK